MWRILFGNTVVLSNYLLLLVNTNKSSLLAPYQGSLSPSHRVSYSAVLNISFCLEPLVGIERFEVQVLVCLTVDKCGIKQCKTVGEALRRVHYDAKPATK